MTDTNINNKEAIEPAEVLEVEPRPTEALKSEWDKSAEAAPRSPFYGVPPLGVTFASKPVDALALINTRGKRNPYNPSLVQVGDTSIDLGDTTGKKKLGVGAKKMLNVALCAFTAANTAKQEPSNLGVFIDTTDYARKNGFEIIAHQMPTPEAQAAEDKRADNAAHNFLAKTRRNLFNLSNKTSFSWTERTKNKVESYSQITFISAFRVTRKSIYVEFGLSAARYLVTQPIRKLPDSMYGIDENRENAYAIAEYLNGLYSQDSNVTRNIEGLTRISYVLEQTSYPTIEDMRKSKSKRTWRDLVKERLESDLDHLTERGVLTTWAYSYPKKRILTDDEATAITTYEEYAELYLYYEIANYSPHEERAAEIEAKHKEQKPRRGAKSKQLKAAAAGGE